jgi:alpha-L-fucosidase
VDDQGAWSYVKDAKFKPVDRLVDNLVDRVGKNGYLLLNVGPRPDGTIPEGAKKCLLGIGEWLEVNGEAIYGTRAWLTCGEGPTTLRKSRKMGFNESDIKYTAKDIRFTVKDDILYAVCLDWPEKEFVIESFVKNNDCILYESEIESVKMLGVDEELNWKMTDEGLKIRRPDKKPCDHAYAFRIARRRP